MAAECSCQCGLGGQHRSLCGKVQAPDERARRAAASDRVARTARLHLSCGHCAREIKGLAGKARILTAVAIAAAFPPSGASPAAAAPAHVWQVDWGDQFCTL